MYLTLFTNCYRLLTAALSARRRGASLRQGLCRIEKVACLAAALAYTAARRTRRRLDLPVMRAGIFVAAGLHAGLHSLLRHSALPFPFWPRRSQQRTKGSQSQKRLSEIGGSWGRPTVSAGRAMRASYRQWRAKGRTTIDYASISDFLHNSNPSVPLCTANHRMQGCRVSLSPLQGPAAQFLASGRWLSRGHRRGRDSRLNIRLSPPPTKDLSLLSASRLSTDRAPGECARHPAFQTEDNLTALTTRRNQMTLASERQTNTLAAHLSGDLIRAGALHGYRRGGVGA